MNPHVNHYCSGCGQSIQTHDPEALGYAPKLESELCQRCFRLKHYKDTAAFKKDQVDSNTVIQMISKISGKIVLIVDVSDIESTLFSGLNRHFIQREFILILTKKDVLPVTVSEQKILKVLQKRLSEENIKVLEAFLISNFDPQKILSVKTKLLKYGLNDNLIVVGYANTGKSSFLNALLKLNLSTSEYANTTLAIQSFPFSNHRIYDTPGIRLESSFLDILSVKNQGLYGINSRLKPRTIQLKGDQCFIFDELLDVSILGDAQSITIYTSEALPMHRTKHLNREKYLMNKDYYLETAKHTYETIIMDDKIDVVFKQLGWVSIHAKYAKIIVTSKVKNSIVFRKAMI